MARRCCRKYVRDRRAGTGEGRLRSRLLSYIWFLISQLGEFQPPRYWDCGCRRLSTYSPIPCSPNNDNYKNINGKKPLFPSISFLEQQHTTSDTIPLPYTLYTMRFPLIHPTYSSAFYYTHIHKYLTGPPPFILVSQLQSAHTHPIIAVYAMAIPHLWTFLIAILYFNTPSH